MAARRQVSFLTQLAPFDFNLYILTIIIEIQSRNQKQKRSP